MINLKIVAPVTLTLLWILFLTVHYFSVYLSAYEAIWWLDILMHTWGGFMIVSTWYQVRSINAFLFVVTVVATAFSCFDGSDDYLGIV